MHVSNTRTARRFRPARPFHRGFCTSPKAAAPALSLPPHRLGSQQQKRGQNSSSRSCGFPLSCREARLCSTPWLASREEDRTSTDPAPLCATTVPPGLSIKQTLAADPSSPLVLLQTLLFLLPSFTSSFFLAATKFKGVHCDVRKGEGLLMVRGSWHLM